MSQCCVYVNSELDYEEDTSKKLPAGNYCLCCLESNVLYINLGTCSHTGFFESISKYKIEFSEMLICYSCHYMLKRIQVFKRQTEDSFIVLTEQAHGLKLTKSRLHNLHISPTHTTDNTNVKAESPLHNYEEPIEIEAHTTVKIEHETSDSETLSEYKKEKKKENIVEDSHEGRIRVIVFNEEEMLNERERCRKMDSYLKLPFKCEDCIVGFDYEMTLKGHMESRHRKVLTALSFFATGSYQKPVGISYLHALSQASVSNAVKEVTRALNNRRILAKHIRFPQTSQERQFIINGFFNKFGFPGCLGCIDGTHVALIKPTEHEERFFNRKHFHSRNVQINKKVNLVCEICKSVLGSELSYKEHMKGHYRRFECSACGKRAHDMFSIESHYNNVHGDIGTRYECEECDFVTNTKRSYRYHKVKHKPKQQCQLCGNTFVTASGLRVHMCVVHKQSKRVFSCTLCHKSYKGPSGLVGHMASSHSGVTAYCDLCNKHFKTANNLANHLKTHSNHVDGQRYSCEDCGSKFRTKVSLVDHIEFVHLKVNKHQCNKCAKIFKSSRGLKRHTTYVHEKVRPPRNKICDQCGRGFTTLTILRSHIRTHTGERPLQCAQCPATFAHSGALYTHNKLLHNATVQR